MKKTICLLVCLLASVTSVFAGTINVSGRAGMYGIPGSSSTSIMYGLAADYAINQNLSVRGALETTTYNTAAGSTTFTPVSVDLIYSQSIQGMLRPYAGAGVSYNTWTIGGTSTTATGAQAEAGIRFDVGGFSAGIEYRYLMPNLNDSSKNSSSASAYATGSFSQSFNI
jgi:outer membrane protein W